MCTVRLLVTYSIKRDYDGLRDHNVYSLKRGTRLRCQSRSVRRVLEIKVKSDFWKSPYNAVWLMSRLKAWCGSLLVYQRYRLEKTPESGGIHFITPKLSVVRFSMS